MSLYDDTLALLRDLIRNACVNDLTPDSGFEERNADTLAEFFAGTDVVVQRFEPHPHRVSIAFTVPGDPAKEPLTLLGHTDVVPVDEDKWTRPPFDAVIEDDVLYGRGAVDMLFITATMAAVTRQVARAGNPGGDLTFVGLADEEARGGLGAKWIAQHHPDAFSWKNCLSETGGSHLPGGVAIIVGEKGAAQRRISIHGDAGHGSTPYGKAQAIALAGRFAAALDELETPVATDALWRGFCDSFSFGAEDLARIADGDYAPFGDLAAFAHAFSHTTISQTVLRAGGAINVLPSLAQVELDIRPLPEHSQDDVDGFLRQALAAAGIDEHGADIEHLITEDATTSPTSGPLWETLVDTVEEFFPGRPVVPTLATGGSDLRFARRAGGCAYGFALHAAGRSLAAANSQLHSHDEALHLEDLRLTVAAYERVVNRFLAGA